MASLYMLVLQQ